MTIDIFGPPDLIIASTFLCVVIAGVLWVGVRSDGGRNDPADGRRESRPIAALALAVDGVLAAMAFVIGILLGVALNGVIRLVASGAWIAVANLAVLFVALLLIGRLHEWLGDKLFPSGICRARTAGSGQRTSRLRPLSLPVGLALGVIFAELGLREGLSGWLL